MEVLEIKKKIVDWANSNFEEFEKGVFSISVDKRRDLLLELFSSLKKDGVEKEDVRLVLGNVLKLCVPLKNIDKKKQWGWANYSATDILTAFAEFYGDPEIDVKDFVDKVFPNLKSGRGDSSAKSKFINGALSVNIEISKSEKQIDAQKEENEDTINPEGMFKLENKPIDLSFFRSKEKMKITRFDPEMDSVLGLSDSGDKDV